MLDRFMHWLGFGLCHQLPERSFSAGGVQLPVCARDTGIYIGFMVSLVVLSIIHRRMRPTGFPPKSVWGIVLTFIGFMAWDGVTSYAGLRTTTNDLRLASGLAMGFALSVVVLPILNDELWRTASSKQVLRPTWRVLVWVGALLVTFGIVRFGAPYLGQWYAVLTASSIIATLAAVNLVVIAMLPAYDRRAETFVAVLPPIAIAVAVAFVEVWLAGALRLWLLGLLA